jgi:hypothetical protein
MPRVPDETAITERLRSEFDNKLDSHRREVGLQFLSMERWIQTASATLDKVVELQIQIHAARESQISDRGLNDEFRRDFRSDMQKLTEVVGEIKTQSAVNAIKISLVVGAGMVAFNAALWAIGKFIP